MGSVNFLPQLVVAWAAIVVFFIFTRVNKRWSVMALSHVSASAMVAASSALVLAALTPVIGSASTLVPFGSSNYAFNEPGENLPSIGESHYGTLAQV